MSPQERAWQHRDYDLDGADDPLGDVRVSAEPQDKPWPVWARRTAFMVGCLFVVFVVLPMVGAAINWIGE